jgi:mono/diheme cytochrome c family protein
MTRIRLLAMGLLSSCIGYVGESDGIDAGFVPAARDAGSTNIPTAPEPPQRVDAGPPPTTWCALQPVIERECGVCHGAVPVPGAIPLTVREHFTAPSPKGGSFLDRSIARLEALPLTTAMPPNIGGTPSDVALFKSWRANGALECSDGGSPLPPSMPTCTSGLTWTAGNSQGQRMNPGEACGACHTALGTGPRGGFIGTIYPTPNEPRLCIVDAVPTNLKVEILDMSGVVRQTMNVASGTNGNFVAASVMNGAPFRARVLIGSEVKAEMRTPQTNTDCNGCHTASGENGATGRIHW